MRDIPTSFGPLSLNLEMARDGDSASIEIEPPHREPPEIIKVHLEHFQKPVKKTKMQLKGDTIIIKVDFE